MSSKFKKVIKKLLSRDNEILTAKEANLMSRFNLFRVSSYESLLNNKIHEIDNLIRGKLQYSSSEKLIALVIPLDQDDLFLDIKKEFSSRGYKCFIVTNKQVEDLGNNKYLFISWDIYHPTID